LTGALAESEVADYLSGMIVGAELAGARATGEQAADRQLRVIAEQGLAVRYERAAVRLGWRTVCAIDHTAPRGLWLTARAIGLAEESTWEPGSALPD
jgi:2-dehydro-3-deoxygalactonokinase